MRVTVAARTSALRRTAAWLVVAAVAGSGCSEAATLPRPDATRANPREYAVSVCERLQSWVDSVEDVVSELSEKGQAVRDDPAARKPLLVSAAASIRRLTAAALSDVDSYGFPDVENGRDFATILHRTIAEADEILAEAEHVTKDIPLDDNETFVYRGAELTQQIEKAFARIRLRYDLLVREYASTDMWEGFTRDACRNYDDPLT